MLVARDMFPMSALDMALLSPYFINLPLAPAQGLVLINAGFDRNSNGQAVSIFESLPTPNEQPAVDSRGLGLVSTGTSNVVTEVLPSLSSPLPAPSSSSSFSSSPSSSSSSSQNNANTAELYEDGAASHCNSTFYLMTPKEFEISETFKHEKIYPQVLRDWTGLDARNGQPLVTSWLTHIERYRASANVRKQWDELAVSFRAEDDAETQLKREKEQHRLERNVISFRESFCNDNDMVKQSNKSPLESAKKRQKQATPHKKLLPNGISTAIINHFRVIPGESVLLCQRALVSDLLLPLIYAVTLPLYTLTLPIYTLSPLSFPSYRSQATAIVNGEIDCSMQIEELCQYMEHNGGFEYFSSADVNRHPMID